MTTDNNQLGASKKSKKIIEFIQLNYFEIDAIDSRNLKQIARIELRCGGWSISMIYPGMIVTTRSIAEILKKIKELNKCMP